MISGGGGGGPPERKWETTIRLQPRPMRWNELDWARPGHQASNRASFTWHDRKLLPHSQHALEVEYGVLARCPTCHRSGGQGHRERRDSK
eukprot:scaffold2938_cov125-Isochrysis_galbana.AAC.10